MARVNNDLSREQINYEVTSWGSFVAHWIASKLPNTTTQIWKIKFVKWISQTKGYSSYHYLLKIGDKYTYRWDLKEKKGG